VRVDGFVQFQEIIRSAAMEDCKKL